MGGAKPGKLHNPDSDDEASSSAGSTPRSEFETPRAKGTALYGRAGPEGVLVRTVIRIGAGVDKQLCVVVAYSEETSRGDYLVIRAYHPETSRLLDVSLGQEDLHKIQESVRGKRRKGRAVFVL